MRQDESKKCSEVDTDFKGLTKYKTGLRHPGPDFQKC